MVYVKLLMRAGAYPEEVVRLTVCCTLFVRKVVALNPRVHCMLLSGPGDSGRVSSWSHCKPRQVLNEEPLNNGVETSTHHTHRRRKVASVQHTHHRRQRCRDHGPGSCCLRDQLHGHLHDRRRDHLLEEAKAQG